MSATLLDPACALLRAVAAPVLLFDAERRLVELTPLAEEELGRTRAAALRSSWEELRELAPVLSQIGSTADAVGDAGEQRHWLSGGTFGPSAGYRAVVTRAEGAWEGWAVVTLQPDVQRGERSVHALGIGQAGAREPALGQDELRESHARLEDTVAGRTAELELVNAELGRALRLKDEFLSRMSHELRTPLNAILGPSEMLLDGSYGALNERQRRVLERLERSGRHLLELIDDVLDISKIEAGLLTLARRPVLVAALCRDALRLVQPLAAARRLTVSFNHDPAVELLEGDERRLRQMLHNLLSNAVKFTPDGGALGLEVTADPDAGVARLTVWDTGVGIADADQRRLFHPFVQLDGSLARMHDGTGLGLALVRSLAELHGGTVGVTSAPGRGSRFSVALPWQPVRRELAPAASPAAGQPPLVLLADDEVAFAPSVRHLSAAGIQVLTAADGHEAVEHLRQRRPRVAVLDTQLDGVSGLMALRYIRAHPGLAACQVVVVTALDLPGDRELYLREGARAYLVKPVRPDELSALVWRLLELPPAADG